MPNKKAQGVITITPGGRGFVSIPNEKDDVEIDAESLNTALHGDVVEIEIKRGFRGRRSGVVLRVVERKQTDFVGVLEKERGYFYLIPDSKRMHQKIRIEGGVVPEKGMKALAHLTKWTKADQDPIGTLTEVIGKGGEHDVEMRAIVLSKGFDTSFPKNVEEEADKIESEKVEFMAKEVSRRRDFRSVTTFTIDPDDAKDFDDAISVQTLSNGNIEIGIHIADVTAYVRPGTAIDDEAQERGTSIYLVDRTIPMLPEVLSNDVCSLNPNEDKLVFSAVFEFDETYEVKNRWFGEAVINSDKRFTYREAQEVLDAKSGLFYKELEIADAVALHERKLRFEAGAIAFDQGEVKFKLDEKGKPIEVYIKERMETNLLIEDLMLLANREVAEYVYTLCKKNPNKNKVFIYRIHDTPNMDRIEELALFLRAIGYDLKTNNGLVSAKDINNLFAEIEGTPEEDLIKTATIRSMAKAVYSTKNIGHFGLAFKYYTHFTSPIRRYPDMMVHRILKSHLDGSPLPTKEAIRYQELAVQSSEREVSAVEAERDSIKYKQVEFLKDHIGEIFTGVISGVTEYGLFVEEEKTRADGLLRLKDIPGDYYSLDEGKYRVVGQKTGKKFSLGDEIRIRLMAANIDDRTIDWGYVGN